MTLFYKLLTIETNHFIKDNMIDMPFILDQTKL